MARENARFIHVDELMPQISVEQVAAYYGVQLPELKRIGDQTRTRCFLACGRITETGDRVLAIQTDHPAKPWHCHQYGCGKGGNLVSMCDLLKPGQSGGGRPRGARFKEIAADLQAMAGGAVAAADAQAVVPPVQPAPVAPPHKNVPLAQSENERARGLVNLDAKFVTAVAAMPPAASAYFRRRPFLSSEVCRNWRMGFLPRDAGGQDKSGGTMRGSIVYGYAAENGEVLTWFGRDPEFEQKHTAWLASDRSSREPEKFHFVKGFHRGLELFGQHRLREPELADKLRQYGLIVVEGPNDVIRLAALGVPAVGLCSNTITKEQTAKAAALAKELSGGVVTLMLDCDDEGENGMRQALWQLAQLVPVRLAWSSGTHDGAFQGRQPESIGSDEWSHIAASWRAS